MHCYETPRRYGTRCQMLLLKKETVPFQFQTSSFSSQDSDSTDRTEKEQKTDLKIDRDDNFISHDIL